MDDLGKTQNILENRGLSQKFCWSFVENLRIFSKFDKRIFFGFVKCAGYGFNATFSPF